MSILVKLGKILRKLDLPNSPKPIEILIENCEFIPDGFQTRLINYFSLIAIDGTITCTSCRAIALAVGYFSFFQRVENFF